MVTGRSISKLLGGNRRSFGNASDFVSIMASDTKQETPLGCYSTVIRMWIGYPTGIFLRLFQPDYGVCVCTLGMVFLCCVWCPVISVCTTLCPSQTREILDAMDHDSGMPLRELQVDGGGTVNSLMMQLQSDLLGIPVGQSSSQHRERPPSVSPAVNTENGPRRSVLSPYRERPPSVSPAVLTAGHGHS